MNNSSESLPESVTHASFESAGALADAEKSVVQVDPDDPPWNVPIAILLWLSSIALIAAVPAAALLLYGLSRGSTPDVAGMAALATSPTGILVQVAATLPAHLLTLLLVWLVATGAGRRPFWRTLGWTHEGGRSPMLWVVVAAVLWTLSSLLTQLLVRVLGAEETAFERLIVSSPEARIASTLR